MLVCVCMFSLSKIKWIIVQRKDAIFSFSSSSSSMLTKILNPVPSHSLSSSPVFPTPLFSLRFHNHFLKTSRKSIPNGATGGGSGLMVRVGARVRAGFTRTPMETPGAYQLVDDETGDKFIVWGGADDDPIDSPIPPREVLSWSPRKSPKSENQGTKNVASTSEGNSLPGKEKRVGRSFGRLKVEKVNALLKKSTQLRRRNSEDDDDLVENESAFDPSLRKRKEKAAIRSGENALGAQESVLRNMTETDDEDMDHPIHQTVLDKHRKSASVSKVKEDFKGWGKGGSCRDFDAETDLRQHHKFFSNSDFFSRKSFKELGFSEFLIESLKKQLFVRPSHIQAMAFQPVMGGNSCIIADQSGSGKTLAYLAPLVQRLRQEELQGLSRSSSKSPRAIILVPTAELATQVLQNCRSMSRYGVPFRSMVVTGGFRQKTQLENLQEGVDVLIATPGRFMYLINEGFLELQNLRCVVLDEVDILCNDEDFEAALQSLISSSPVTTQYLFVTATLPIDIYNKLVEIFPDCKVIMGPGMHRTSPGLEEILVDCSGDGGTEKTPDTAFINKKSALLQIVEERPVPKTIVFCNKIETCRKVENVLKRFDRKGVNVRVLPFHAALEQGSRLANMKEFSASPAKGVSLFLVCTDRASRGIDFAGVDHVILFDYPRDPSEYVRRVGRTARGAGGKGRAFVFAVGKQVSLARRVMERNQKGHPLHDVPSAYELVS